VQESGCDMVLDQTSSVTRLSVTTKDDGLHQAHVTWFILDAMFLSHVDGLPMKVRDSIPAVFEKEPGFLPDPGTSILLEVTPLTGEPDAGNPPVRFGGRGGRD